MRRIGKRGAGHIEIIISILLFVGFILFIFLFFNPIKSSKVGSEALPRLFNNVVNEINTELETYSIRIDEDYGENEYIIIKEINGVNKNVRVEDYLEGEALASELRSSGVALKPKNIDWVLIKMSEDIVETFNLDGGDIENKNAQYTISSTGKRDVLSQLNIEAFKQKYDDDYSNLKKELGIQGFDFDFRIVLSDKEVYGEKFVPVGVEVYSKYRRSEVLKKDGKVEFADFTIRVW